MKILIVLTSHSEFGDTGNATGFWLEELASPYYAFKEAGLKVSLASPKGGKPPIDPTSMLPDNMTEAAHKFLSDQQAVDLLNETVELEEIKANEYDAVFYPGGHGPLWDLAQSQTSQTLINDFHEQNKPIAAVCHGLAALLHVKNSSGTYLISGSEITGFTDQEEEQAGATLYVPFSVEQKAIEYGAFFKKADNWASFALVDGQLITGQNPQSSQATADILVEKLTA